MLLLNRPKKLLVKENAMIAEKLRHIGKIVKLHGFEGDALIIFDEAFSKKITKAEWVFLIINGLPVPFFISKLDIRLDSTAIIKLSDIDSSEDIKKLIGCEVAIIETGRGRQSNNISQTDIAGYRVIDENAGEIGNATSVLNFNNNIVLQVFKCNKEILIPIAEEIILNIDDSKQIISVSLPEGLIELNS
jgi:16S rRNA processing protein RimM